jgi:hypothetical protein
LATFEYDEGAYVDVSYPDTTAAVGGVTCSNSAQVCITTGQAAIGTVPDGSTGTVATASVLTPSTWKARLAELTAEAIDGIESTACAPSLCVAVGYGSGTAAAAATYDPSPGGQKWSPSTLPAGITNLQQVTCPGATECLAIGSGSTGPVVLTGTIAGKAISWTNDTLPAGVSALDHITCPSTTVCVALGTSPTGSPIVLSGTTSGTWAWTLDSLPPSVATLTQLTCPSASSCEAIGSGTSPAEILTGTSTSGWTWATAGIPATVTSLAAMDCPTTSACVAVGSGAAGATVVAGGTTKPWTVTSVAGATSLAGVACTGATTCIAIGSKPGGPAIMGGGTTHAWSSDTVTGVSSLRQILCPGTGVCLAIGSSPSGAAVLTGAASPTAEAWTAGSLHGGPDPAFFSGIGCFKSTTSGAGEVCAAPGGGRSGAALFSAQNTVPTATTWTTHAPSTGTGVVAGGLATFVSSTALSNLGFTACGPSATDACTSVGPLFPFTVGYTVGAGMCATDLDNAAVHVKSVPGSTATKATKVTLPLAFLEVKVVNGFGQAVAGATVSATIAGVAPPHTSCNGGTYTFGTTGGAGTVAAAAMFGTYVVAVTSQGHTMTKTVTLSTTSDVVTSQRLPLPDPVVYVT